MILGRQKRTETHLLSRKQSHVLRNKIAKKVDVWRCNDEFVLRRLATRKSVYSPTEKLPRVRMNIMTFKLELPNHQTVSKERFLMQNVWIIYNSAVSDKIARIVSHYLKHTLLKSYRRTRHRARIRWWKSRRFLETEKICLLLKEGNAHTEDFLVKVIGSRGRKWMIVLERNFAARELMSRWIAGEFLKKRDL